MLDFAIGIVLYNPSKASKTRILNFAIHGVEIYVYDNSVTFNEELSNAKNINYTSNGINIGLSKSIDFLCKKTISDNYKYLLFFDQDTDFTTDTLYYIQKFISYKENSSNNFFDLVLSVNFREKTIEGNKLNILSKDKIDIYDIITIFFNINSGTLFFLEKYKCFQWFDKKYFVDGVDYAFSLNVFIHNFKNISISNVPGLNHTEEQGDTIINFLGKKISSRIYPISRNIDFLRSHIMLLFKSFKVKYFKPKFFILKAIFSYVAVQLIFRLYKIFN